MKPTKNIFNAYALFLVLTILLMSCSSSTTDSDVESTEDNAIKELAETYGSVTSISKGLYTGTENGNGKYYEVEITNPNLFVQDADMLSYAGGAAYILYKNFSEEERTSYTRYDVIIKDTTSQEVQFKVPASDAQLFYEQAKIAIATMETLLQGEFALIDKQYIPERQYGPDSLKILFDSLLVRSGKNRKVEIYQARQLDYELENGSKMNVVGFQGAIQNENEPVDFVILLDPTKKENNIVRIRYN